MLMEPFFPPLRMAIKKLYEQLQNLKLTINTYIYTQISQALYIYITDKPSQSVSQINQPINQQTPAFGLGKAVEIGTSTAGCA